MSSQNMHRIFGALHTLERSLDLCKNTMLKNSNLPERITGSIAEQERIIKHMRRVANKLQFELAQQDWAAVHRSLNIFYSLNQMVRPEIMSTYRELSGVQQNSLEGNETVRGEGAVFH